MITITISYVKYSYDVFLFFIPLQNHRTMIFFEADGHPQEPDTKPQGSCHKAAMSGDGL